MSAVVFVACSHTTQGAVSSRIGTEECNLGAVIGEDSTGTTGRGQAKSATKATAAFKDVHGDLVDAGLEPAGTLFLAGFATPATTGLHVGYRDAVDVDPDRIVTTGTGVDEEGGVGEVLNVGDRNGHDIVVADAIGKLEPIIDPVNDLVEVDTIPVGGSVNSVCTQEC